MNTIDQLRELFLFNDWANAKLIGTIENTGCDPALKYLTHLLVTEREYFDRISGKKDSTGFDFWPDRTIDECDKLKQDNDLVFREFLTRQDENCLEDTVFYTTSEGIPYTNTIREMLAHVLLHSMTHRGQALSALRRSGFEPPKIDYIIYLRER